MRTIFTIKAEEKKLEEEKRDTRDGTCVKDRQSSYLEPYIKIVFFDPFFLKFVVFEPIFQKEKNLLLYVISEKLRPNLIAR
jgi:hypothetical protein